LIFVFESIIGKKEKKKGQTKQIFLSLITFHHLSAFPSFFLSFLPSHLVLLISIEKIFSFKLILLTYFYLNCSLFIVLFDFQIIGVVCSPLSSLNLSGSFPI